MATGAETAQMLHTSDRQVADRSAGAPSGESAPPAVMQLDNVTRYFGRRAKHRHVVLRNVSLAVPPGEVTHIGGSNGAGKTTLLRLMAGILRPNEGTVSIGGLSSERSWRDFHRQIGFLSAGDRGLYARLTVRAHLEYWCALAFVAPEQRPASVEEGLSSFGLDGLADRRAERLSQGQRQRLRLALALAHRPRILLLDEPRNSLDAEGLERLGSGVRAAIGRGASVVWCSPPGEDQPVAFDRRLLLEDGQVRPL
ncbi:MAG TPA: ABC transporter ATP-binding protein [Solirubrobacteraceae bacterium]|nr:ABC transporter ATP-binding protein [Solirubrobacteraceae bacterium]